METKGKTNLFEDLWVINKKGKKDNIEETKKKTISV